MIDAITAPFRNAARVSRLVRVFKDVATTRMAGLPVMNAALRVEAIGFEPEGEQADAGLGGVLITPWFMNLVWLPADAGGSPLPVGAMRTRRFGGEQVEFTGAQIAEFGCFEACSLWSPMFDFPDQATARATAHEVLALLRKPVAPPSAPEQPSRRALLMGRSAAAGRTP